MVLREAEDLDPGASECWDWVLTFGGSKSQSSHACSRPLISFPFPSWPIPYGRGMRPRDCQVSMDLCSERYLICEIVQ